MVVWSEYYRFSAEEVESIYVSDSETGSHPYKITVTFKSGRSLCVSYADMASRKSALNDLTRQIDREKREDFDKIHNALYLLQGLTNRIDKRQLRIYRQLRSLLGIKVAEADDGT